MPNDADLALTILEHMDIAVFKRDSPMGYSLFGRAPGFYQEIFREEDGSVCFEPWLKSSMLEFFIVDAETFFERGLEGEIVSGIWREEGVGDSKALYAIAKVIEGVQLLILRSLDADYIERARILQKAREQLLVHRFLRSDLESYKRKATYDVLTGLLNRASLMEALDEEIKLANESAGFLSFLILDIDDFKKVNDTFGHLAGDAVLSRLGQILTHHLRRGDIAGRYGGEELVILVPGASSDKAFLMAEKVRKRIADYDFQLPRAVTVSIGCTAYIHGESQEALIARADLALYDAKRQTKNMVVLK